MSMFCRCGPGRESDYGPPPRPLAEVAEADAAALLAAELDERDLVGRDQDAAAFLGGQRQEPGAVGSAQRGLEVTLDLCRGRVGFHDELARDGLDPDLDFHAAPLFFGGATPRTPRLRLRATLCWLL